MVVVLIVGIIAAIAYPSYRRSVLKSHRADGKTALMDYAQQLERCYTQYNAYNNNNCQAYKDISGGNSATSDEGYYKVSGTFATSDQYKLTASPTSKGGQQDDTGCAKLYLNQAGKKWSSGGGSSCW